MGGATNISQRKVDFLKHLVWVFGEKRRQKGPILGPKIAVIGPEIGFRVTLGQNKCHEVKDQRKLA